ncbi:hypothetical protein [Yoonia sediminilitoris]|uniref:Uncharacterized protein n=1 Tax=Yoonia sediminilitoris TaxID=1286148 RepID=A0A2T6K625_9RHOB|nr:hypothetical protein [Yoonia sediminilitoris]PUB10070.1 hypothetical protein C8N45_12222 [Yoonia sediminilitoris]RCW89666.1 hypothetical protein DFP92_12222 [Yoonia sediminilitoris]
MSEIILGSPSQVQTVKRANALWAILQADPRFAFQGRTVSVAFDQDNASELAISLSRLQGYASCHFVDRQNAQNFSDAYKAAGLNPQIWEQFWGRDSALMQSHSFLQDFRAPRGLKLLPVTPVTSDETISRICEMSLGAGVLPAPGSVMRGQGLRTHFAYVEASDGQIVAAGGACMAYHADSPKADVSVVRVFGTKSVRT